MFKQFIVPRKSSDADLETIKQMEEEECKTRTLQENDLVKLVGPFRRTELIGTYGLIEDWWDDGSMVYEVLLSIDNELRTITREKMRVVTKEEQIASLKQLELSTEDSPEKVRVRNLYLEYMNTHGAAEFNERKYDQLQTFLEENVELVRLRKDYVLTLNSSGIKWGQRTDYTFDETVPLEDHLNRFFKQYFRKNSVQYEQYNTGNRKALDVLAKANTERLDAHAKKINATDDKLEFIKHCLQHFQCTQLSALFHRKGKEIDLIEKLTGVTDMSVSELEQFD